MTEHEVRSRWAHRLARLPSRVVGSVRAGRLFEESAMYTLREVLPARGRQAFYVPRGAAHGVTLRHHTPDQLVVKEIFGRGDYNPPPVIRAALAKLGRPPRVLDLGGHIGVFGVFALTFLPGATVVSLEPDPASFALLNTNARRSGADWTVLMAAAAPQTGWARFAATGGPNAGLRSDRRQADDRPGERTC